MKKLLAMIMATLMIATVLTGCGSKKEGIIIGLDDTFAPMGFRNEKNELVGFDIDLAKAMGEKMGVKITFQPIDWDAKEMELNGGKVDLLWNGMSKTPEREASMNLSKPYLNNDLVIMTKASSDIDKKVQLKGKKVGVQAGSSGLNVVKIDSIYNDIKNDLVEYKTYDEAIMDLENGRLDAIIVDKSLGKYKSSKKPNTFKFATEDFGKDLYVIGMKKGNDDLTKKVNKALDDVIADGTASKISNTWFGEDILVK